MSKKKKVKPRKRRASPELRQFRTIAKELSKDPVFQKPEPSLYSQGRALEVLNPPERRKGHSALRVSNRKLEVFDPHPGNETTSPETDEFTRYKSRTPVEWYHFCRKMEQRLRLALREYKKGWDAFHTLRRINAAKLRC